MKRLSVILLALACAAASAAALLLPIASPSLLEALGPTALCLLIALLAAAGIAHLTGPEVPATPPRPPLSPSRGDLSCPGNDPPGPAGLGPQQHPLLFFSPAFGWLPAHVFTQ